MAKQSASRPDNDYDRVGFLDGRADPLTVDDFEEQQKQHEKALQELAAGQRSGGQINKRCVTQV
ncbi:MAG: hypothetical protein ACPG4Q_10010 [Phycisphaeraceae bacterium]